MGGYEGDGVERGGAVHNLESEYGREINCDARKSGNTHGGRVEYRVTGINMVMGTGRDKLHGVADGGGS